MWFTTLPANSIIFWADLEKQFHHFAFIQRFRDVKNWWFSLVLSDQQLVEVAFQGLLPHIREKYASQEFCSISQMAHRMTEEARPYEQKRSNF